MLLLFLKLHTVEARSDVSVSLSRFLLCAHYTWGFPASMPSGTILYVRWSLCKESLRKVSKASVKTRYHQKASEKTAMLYCLPDIIRRRKIELELFQL